MAGLGVAEDGWDLNGWGIAGGRTRCKERASDWLIYCIGKLAE